MLIYKTIQDEVIQSPEKRFGDWIQTYSAISFWPLDARAEEIEIVDIAHSLSLQCRFAGHCEEFYSVAEHCCHIFDHVSEKNKLWGLLHDASEAYLVDLPRPVKRCMPQYKDIETNLMKVISHRFQLPEEMPHEVHEADMRILFDEAKQNMKEPPIAWVGVMEPLGIKLQYWSPKQAKEEFLQRYHYGMKLREIRT